MDILEKVGFDGKKYIQIQKDAIQERVKKFSHRLYLEVGGKLLYDGHASRVLPGFDPTSKEQIFSSLFESMDIIFCINYEDIIHNRQLVKEDVDYTEHVEKMLAEIEKKIGGKPFIACNKCPRTGFDQRATEYINKLQIQGYAVYKRYIIPEYPHNVGAVLSESGYGYDEYIPCVSSLVLVTGAASNSGKMSTCLGQIYHDYTRNEESGYAKYETFPIWNIPLKHPINLAYEAATADISDYNMLDPYHLEAYGIESVNYNRDVDAFDIVKKLADAFLPENNYTRIYKSPTDMGINMAGFCITDDQICREASLAEIRRRGKEYQGMIDRGEGEVLWVEKCNQLEKECEI